MTDEQFKKLNAKTDSIDKKLDVIMDHLNLKSEDPPSGAPPVVHAMGRIPGT